MESISAAFDADHRSGSIAIHESKEATGVPEVGRIGRRGGRQRPALGRAIRRSGDARRENAPSPGLVCIGGPRALRCPRSRLRTRARRASNAARTSTKAKSFGTSRPTQVGAWRREHAMHEGCSENWFGVQTSVRTHRRPRRPWDCESKPVDTRGLARTTHDSRGDARIGGEGERTGAGVLLHAVHKTARRGSVERAQATSGASPSRCGSGDSGCPRAASACESNTNVRVLGAWTRPL